MNTVYLDSPLDDEARREQLFQGQLFVFSPRPSVAALCKFAREMTEAAFAPLDPREAQHSLKVEEFVAILADLKPKFINHPESKRLIRAILQDFGCELENTYFDVPKLRTATDGGYLTNGIAYAFPPHRDTWYSGPHCQLNWWLPVYDIVSENSMAFHPLHWSRPVRNQSRVHDYDKWNKVDRKAAAQHIKTDTRDHPRLEEDIEQESQLRIVCPVGGMILFSGAHLHSSVPNTSGVTRVSIDFRTVHMDDLRERRGAANVDCEAKGTTLVDYYRADDFSRLPEEYATGYNEKPAFVPEVAAPAHHGH